MTPSFLVLDHHRVGKAGVGAADILGDVGMLDSQALDVCLVDDGVVVLRAWMAVVLPVEKRVDDDGLHRMWALSSSLRGGTGHRSRS